MRSFLILWMLLISGCSGQRDLEQSSSKPVPKPEGEGFHAESRSKKIDTGYARHLKVILLEQGFRHEARWLNQNLKRDEGLDYQAFFVDADPGWPQPTSIYDDAAKRRVKSLRAPFWQDGTRITEKEAFLALSYDVIIVGDIDPESTEWRDEYWQWLELWTRSGGGLIFSAGMRYNPGACKSESSQKVLPMTRVETGAEVDTTKIKYWGLTDEGLQHGILQLSNEKGRVRELLGSEVDGKFERGQLDGLYWYAANLKPIDGATVLARAVVEGGQVSEGAPILVAMDYGKGRVVFVGTEDTNRWRAIVGERYFYRFWQNAMAWAAKAEK